MFTKHANITPNEVMAVMCRMTRKHVGPLTTTIGGAIAFMPRGSAQGWRLDLDAPGGAWSVISARDASACAVVVDATERSFVALLEGGTSMQQSSAAGEIRIAGDRGKLQHLGRLLAGGNSLLSLRVKKARSTS